MRLVVSPSSSASLIVEEVVDASALMVMLCNSVYEVIQTLGFFMSWITLICMPKHFFRTFACKQNCYRYQCFI